MKNYSFSSIAAEDQPMKKSTELTAYYRHSELMAQQANQRIEQIKKKYDTPSRRQRINTMKASQDLSIPNKQPQESKENLIRSRQRQSLEDCDPYRPAPTFGPNPLKESYAVNRLQKSALRKDVESKQLDNFRKESRGYDPKFQTYSKEDQEALFSKVRQMKESLCNKDYMRSSINPRSSITSIKPNQQNSRQFDPRVENIDKINSKIKQILSCLENERNPSKYIRQSPKKSYLKDSTVTPPLQRSVKKSYLKEETHSKDSIIANPDPKGSYIFTKTPIGRTDKSYSGMREQLDREPHLQVQKNQQNNEEISFEQKKDLSAKKENLIMKYQQEYSRTPAIKHIDHKLPLQASRSRSQVAFSTTNKDDTLKSGKKLNDEISRIQSKIEAMEREKKKLNIQFTPFSSKNRSTSALHSTTYHHNSIDSHKERTQTDNKTSVPHFRTSSSTKDRVFSSQFGKISEPTELKIKEEKATTDKPEKSLQKLDIEIKTARIDKQEENFEQNSAINSQQSSQFRQDYSDVKKRTDEGIEQRKKRLQYCHSDIIRTDSLKKLVSLFCQQAKLDEHFRNMKIWLEEVIDKEKFSKMSAILETKGREITPQETEVLFKLDESENNPFFSIQSSQGSLQSAVSAYIEAENHWVERVSHQFSKQSLMSQGFTKGKIDLQRKGFIQLQDVVRLLNIESGTFYRNRDIFLIFKRLTGKEKASFQDLLNGLCP